MVEKVIYFETIDPIDFFGVNNSNIDLLKTKFPKIKMIARGNELKLIGDEEEIQKFEEKFDFLVHHFEKYNNLSNSDIEKIINGKLEKKSASANDNDIIVFGNNGKAIKAITPNQKVMVEKYNNNDLIFAIGPAGSGKTYTAIAMAVRALKNKEVKRIILSRPAVEAGERLGFLPGDIKEKIDPYLQPLYDALFDMIPARKLESYVKDGVIQIAPLAFMRGRTLDNAFVILDEAQNTTLNQLKMFLTRMGKFSKFIVTGDITQIDLPRKRDSGLIQAINILKDIKGIAIVYLNLTDIIRHKLVKSIVEAYEKSNIK
ncbi:MAG: PhoH family protein [Bacteroidales bacterium]|nr:PhoH family protein [Bacteroidales bacterium]